MRLFIALILALLPSISLAQRITVRSGEHADFSRLVFEFPDPEKWEMGRIDGGYEIRLQDNDRKIDISKVYLRITHNRIKNIFISHDNSRVVINLNCECHADAFEFRPGLLVVDVKDGKPPVTSRFETAFKSGELSADRHTTVNKSKEALPSSDEGSERIPVDVPSLNLSDVPVSIKLSVGAFSLDPIGEIVKSTPQVAEMQAKIIKQIGRAASQGLLDANLSKPIQQAINHHHDESITPPHTSPSLTPKPHINIHIQNSIDREFSALTKRHLTTPNGRRCMPASLFNIAEWGDKDSILSRVSMQRGAVLGEFDIVDVQEVKVLVRAYIYAGFGVEALNVLNAFDVTLVDEKILIVMAQIVDGIAPNYDVLLAGQIGCDSASALWAALSLSKISASDEVNGAAILSAFSALPIHLRRRLGPALAQKFLNSRDVEMARGLRNAIARASGDPGPEFHLLEARLDLERGRDEAAEHVLEGIINSDKEIAPKALIELLEIRLQRREAIDPKTLATAESYIFEQGETKIAMDLKRLIALSLGQAGDFLTALDMLTDLKNFGKMEKHHKEMMWGGIVEELTTEAPEDILLRFVFLSMDELSRQNISRDIRRKLASRLLNEGWPEKAEMVLAATKPLGADDRIILAEVEIIKGHPDLTLEFLENVAGNKAAKLRAIAYEKLGKHQSAVHEYQILMDEENQRSAAWRGKDWEQLARIGSQTDQAVAKMMLSQNPDGQEVPATIGTIAFDSSLLAKSKEERSTIEQLLKEYPFIMHEDS